MLSRAFQKCVSSTQLTILCFDFYYWSFATSVACIAIHSVAFARSSKRRRNFFCFCVCTLWWETSMNDSSWNVWSLSEYTITYRFKRFAKNLLCSRISETKTEWCTQQFVSTPFCVCTLLDAKHVACLDHMRTRNCETCCSCAIIRFV